jgi:hypothetical protein
VTNVLHYSRTLGGEELLPPLLQLSKFPQKPALTLDDHQVITLLSELATAYTATGSSADLVDIIGIPILQKAIDKLGAKQGSIQAMLAALSGANAGSSAVMDLTESDWRAVARAVNELAEVKIIAAMVCASSVHQILGTDMASRQFTEMPNWGAPAATAPTFEIESLLGPLLRLGCFFDAFVSLEHSLLLLLLPSTCTEAIVISLPLRKPILHNHQHSRKRPPKRPQTRFVAHSTRSTVCFSAFSTMLCGPVPRIAKQSSPTSLI